MERRKERKGKERWREERKGKERKGKERWREERKLRRVKELLREGMMWRGEEETDSKGRP